MNKITFNNNLFYFLKKCILISFIIISSSIINLYLTQNHYIKKKYYSYRFI